MIESRRKWGCDLITCASSFGGLVLLRSKSESEIGRSDLLDNMCPCRIRGGIFLALRSSMVSMSIVRCLDIIERVPKTNVNGNIFISDVYH